MFDLFLTHLAPSFSDLPQAIMACPMFDVLTLRVLVMPPPNCSFGGICKSQVEATGLLIDFSDWAYADQYVCN